MEESVKLHPTKQNIACENCETTTPVFPTNKLQEKTREREIWGWEKGGINYMAGNNWKYK